MSRCIVPALLVMEMPYKFCPHRRVRKNWRCHQTLQQHEGVHAIGEIMVSYSEASYGRRTSNTPQHVLVGVYEARISSHLRNSRLVRLWRSGSPCCRRPLSRKASHARVQDVKCKTDFYRCVCVLLRCRMYVCTHLDMHTYIYIYIGRRIDG